MFNEQNAVEEFVLNCLNQLGWDYRLGTQLERSVKDVFLHNELYAALQRLNPEIAANPTYIDDVMYEVNAITGSVHNDGLVRCNELLVDWLRGDKTMPFGAVDYQHVPVRLIDFDNLNNNSFIVANQVTFKPFKDERRFDIVLFVNGIPLVVGEAKTPVRQAISWLDGAEQIQRYERDVAGFFVPNVFSFATEGKDLHFGSIQMPLDMWGPWREEESTHIEGLSAVQMAVEGLLTPVVVLDILQYFTAYATDKQRRRNKLICRYQQYLAGNKILDRVIEGRIKKGLIWHFQGSGKSLLMVFTAQKLRLHPALKNPTVLIVVDRTDLDAQITATFNAADIPNTVTTEKREELQRLLTQDTRKIIITTIHKFGEMEGVINSRSNIILLVDEAHRTQEGDLGRKMRDALPNAFLFGLTGTPINKRDRNTFWAFGSDTDERGYLSRYSFQDSIRDGATLPLYFEARLVELRVDKAAIDEAFANITGNLSEAEQSDLAKRAARMNVLIKTPKRIQAIVNDIVKHYQDVVEPNGFKAMIVTFDREACILYKRQLDQYLPAEASEIIMTAGRDDPEEWRRYDREEDEETRILNNFRDPDHPLKFLIVTARLLAGFDAPILQALYLDKPIKEHNLLQAICRVNRPFPRHEDAARKTHGLIVDYIGVFDDVARSLSFEPEDIEGVFNPLNNLLKQVPGAINDCLSFFPNVDRTVIGYEGLMAAQECLPNNEVRDEFAKTYSILHQMWEALSPNSMLTSYIPDYRWLTQVYESVKPSSGHGKLVWYALGAKTLELIHQNIFVENVRDDLDTLVMDAEIVDSLLSGDDKHKAKQFEFQLIARLRKHKDDPRFIDLGKKLEELRDRHERGLLLSIAYLKALLDLARDTVRIERAVVPETPPEEKGVAALTELFNETRSMNTPVMVERIVTDIDSIVRIVRFPGWQTTSQGEREVQQELRKTLKRYELHKENDLFTKAYGYIREYY